MRSTFLALLLFSLSLLAGCYETGPGYYGGGGYYRGGGYRADDAYQHHKRQEVNCNNNWQNCAAICNTMANPNQRAVCVANCNNALNQCKNQ